MTSLPVGKEGHCFLVVKRIDVDEGGPVWNSISGSVESDTVSLTARHRCDVSSKLCFPGAKQ